MKKISALFLVLSLVVISAASQNITSDAGLKVPVDGIRTSDQGFASQEFRRGV